MCLVHTSLSIIVLFCLATGDALSGNGMVGGRGVEGVTREGLRIQNRGFLRRVPLSATHSNGLFGSVKSSGCPL